MKQLHRLVKTGYKERKILLITSILIAAIRLGLWLLPFKRLLALLDEISHFSHSSQISVKGISVGQISTRQISTRQASTRQISTRQISVRKIVWSVNSISHYIPGMKCKCLARALTTQVLMKRYGHTPKLQMGVAKTGEGKLEAHAWVEFQGIVIIGNLPDLSRFLPLPSLEGVNP